MFIVNEFRWLLVSLLLKIRLFEIASLEELAWNLSGIAENVVDRVVQSVATFDELLLSNWLPQVDISLGNRFVLSDSIVELDGNIKAFMRVGFEVNGLVDTWICDDTGVSRHEVSHLWLEIVP